MLIYPNLTFLIHSPLSIQSQDLPEVTLHFLDYSFALLHSAELSFIYSPFLINHYPSPSLYS
jgi:hypothetical protein